MLPCRTITLSINCTAEKLYSYVINPENLSQWGKSFCLGATKFQNQTETAGVIKIKFAVKNDFGILDHSVKLSDNVIYNFMRVIPNGQGCEVIVTLFQLDDQFFKDVSMMKSDLKRLKKILESS